MTNFDEDEPKNQISKLSWDKLVVDAQDGMRGGGAHVEAMRRVVLSVNRFSDSSDKYSRRMWWLTIAIGFLAVVQTIPALKTIKEWAGY